MRKILINIFIFILGTATYAQTPKLTATCNVKQVGVNSYFQVTYKLTGGTAQSFVKPSFKNFNVIGQYQSSGGGMTVIVNGKVVQGGEDETSWTYQLSPTATGKFTIDPAKAQVNGQWIQSNSLSVEVGSGNSNQSNTNHQNNKTNNTQKNTPSNSGNNDLFLQAYANKSNPMQGEQVIVTFKIYTRIPVTQYAINKLASFTGFWSQDLMKDVKNPPQSTEYVNGVQYNTATIRQVSLFAQKSGYLTIEPQEVECMVQVKSQHQANIFDNFFNDPFFNIPQMFDSYQNVKKTIRSNSLAINVRPLPLTDKPTDFNGAVGSFSLHAEIDKTQLPANDAATLKFTINGKGNLNLIDKLTVDFPPDFETYDPKINDKITSNASGVSGSRTFEYLIIPRNAGVFKIKPITFSYFDLTKQKYVSLTSPEFVLKVGKGTGSSNVTVSGVNQEDIKYIGSDIRYIKNKPFVVNKIGSIFFGSYLFFGILLLPLLLFIVFVIIWRKQLKLHSDVAMMKNKKATKIALKRLKLASQFMEQQNKAAFYEEISKGLWGYLSDKLTIPLANLSKDNIVDALQKKNVNDQTTEKFMETLNDCEYARFAPATEEAALRSAYDNAFDVIIKLEKELK